MRVSCLIGQVVPEKLITFAGNGPPLLPDNHSRDRAGRSEMLEG
jgi:hypothetical protein